MSYYRKSREELIEELKAIGWYKDEKEKFYKLSHEQKSNKDIFIDFCKKNSGYEAIVLSDDEICDNKELVIIAKENGFFSGYHLLSKRLLSDPEMALILADCNKYEFTNIAIELRRDINLMLQALKINPGIYSCLPVSTKTDVNIVYLVASLAPGELAYLLDTNKAARGRYCFDLELAKVVAKSGAWMLPRFFDSSILSNQDILKSIFISDDTLNREKLIEEPWAFEYFDSAYWCNDYELVKLALEKNSFVFEFLPYNFRNDKRLALQVIEDCPEMLMFCSDNLRNDKELILCVFKEETNGELLNYTSAELRDDFDVAFAAVGSEPVNLLYVSDRLKDNKKIVIHALEEYGGVLEYASERLQCDEELIKLSQKNI